MKLDYERGEHFREGDTETKPLNARQQVTLLVAALVFSGLISAVIAAEISTFSWGEFAASLVPTFFGSAITIFWLEIIVKRRTELERLITQLIVSQNNEAQADIVMKQLYLGGWLQNGALANQFFANLHVSSFLEKADFHGCHFAYLRCSENVRETNFQRCVFIGCDFSNVRSIRSVNFQHAKLSVSNDFSGSDIYDTSFARAILENVRFYNLDNGIGAVLRHVVFNGATLKQCDFTNTTLQHNCFANSKLESCNFTNASISQAVFHNARLNECNFDGTILEDVDFSGAYLIHCKFPNLTPLTMMFGKLTLPDGTLWDDSTDMTRFTDPSHPEFWEPDWVKEAKPSSSNQL